MWEAVSIVFSTIAFRPEKLEQLVLFYPSLISSYAIQWNCGDSVWRSPMCNFFRRFFEITWWFALVVVGTHSITFWPNTTSVEKSIRVRYHLCGCAIFNERQWFNRTIAESQLPVFVRVDPRTRCIGSMPVIHSISTKDEPLNFLLLWRAFYGCRTAISVVSHRDISSIRKPSKEQSTATVQLHSGGNALSFYMLHRNFYLVRHVRW